MDLPRSFTIRERSHRVLNPLTDEKLAQLGNALRLEPDTTLLDLASGKGELLCTWARDHRVTGTGVDVSSVFTQAAKDRAAELGVADRVAFVRADATGYQTENPVDVASCLGATWIGGGTAGTIEQLSRSLRPKGIALVGECFWRADPPDQTTVAGCHARNRDDFHDLAGLVALFHDCGWDVVEMVLADQDSWDRYVAAQWLNIRRWLDENPHDDLADEMRSDLTASQLNYTRYQRDYLGWGVFALMRR
jgi:SAM-dependent methyltransferase